MKKFRAISTLALSVLMCGSICLAGCGDNGEKKEDSKPTPADAATKTEVMTGALSSLESIVTGGKAYKVTLDVDFAGTSKDAQGATVSAGVNVDGSVYFQYTPGENPAINLDATIDGKMSGVAAGQNPDLYAAAYLRTDTVTFGYLNQKGISDDQKKNMPYMQMAMEDVVAMLQGSVPFTVDSDSMTGTVSSVYAAMLADPAIQTLLTKMANGVIAGAEATVVKKGDVTTLTYDVAAEITSIYNTVKTVVDSLNENTKLKDVLDNPAVKAFFNKYFSSLTAAEVKAAASSVLSMVMKESVQLPDPAAGQSAYDYIVSTVKTMFADYMEVPVGDAELKAEMNMALTQVKAALDMFKEYTVSVSVKNNVFYGFGMSLDLSMAEGQNVDCSFSVTMEETTYTFVDVTKLNVAK